MTGPIDTIRETLRGAVRPPQTRANALAALAEVEQQLANPGVRYVTMERFAREHDRAVAAEQRANDLADALRQIADEYHGVWIAGRVARAALDRHTHGAVT